MPRQHASQGLEAGGMGPLRARERALFLDFPRRVVGDVHSGVAPAPASAGIELQANGSLPLMPVYLPVPPVMIWVPQARSGCDLSRSRVSKVEKILSPSASASTQAPSIYFLAPDSMLSAWQRADILSSICSRLRFSVVPTGLSVVTVPTPGTSMFISGRNTNCVT